MNVVHLVTNRAWGGGERYVLDLCTALRADGHHVDVLTRGSGAARERFETHQLRRGSIGTCGTLDFISPVKLAGRLRRIPGSVVVHVHNFKAAVTAVNARELLADPARVRIVCTRHLVRTKPLHPSQLRLLAKVDDIIFVSDAVRRAFVTANPTFSGPRLHTILNAIPYPTRAQKVANAEPVIAFVGRLAPEKSLDTLIKALARVKERPWQAVIGGTGQGRVVMPLLRLARDLDLADRISWPGHIKDVYGTFARADIVVLPSRVPEAFGLSLLEAMSQATAVISTDNGAQPEIITDGVDGLLVPPDDEARLADAIASLLDDPDGRKAMAERGRETFETRFSYDKFYESVKSVYFAGR